VASAESLLYLFSSNFRPQYEQDILDVLAAPRGSLQLFRYESRVCLPDTRQRWDSLVGMRALINYSLQQRAHYFDPVFVPIRLASVTRSFSRGDSYFVEFRVEDYISLPQPTKEESGYLNLAEHVGNYTRLVREARVPHPYTASAGLGKDILPAAEAANAVDTASDEIVLFERTTHYLQQTASFANARFIRFLDLAPEGGKSGESDLPGADGVIELDSGRTYELRVYQYQPGGIDSSATFSISVDKSAAEVVGRTDLEIASDYDLIPIIFRTTDLSTAQSRETPLVIEPAAGVQGPRITLKLRLRAPTKQLMANALLTFVGLALVGTASLFPVPKGVSALIAVAAGIFLATMRVFGRFAEGIQAPNLDFLSRGKTAGASDGSKP
jgi:hypothetical protein